ncbi:MAG: cysteine hydrolase family protein, partial [Beijerinckiaceae bacterium]
EDERKVYEQAGFSLPASIGENTALLVIDVTYGFTGREGLTIEESIKEFATACGPASWEAMPRIKQLIAMFRELGRPVIYTRSAPDDTPFTGRATKGKRLAEAPPGHNDIPDVIAPRPGEWVLEKTKASAFFQTPLASYLVRQKIDSVIVCGVSTSGCVRASVVDCLSNGFTTFVVDDCCFDRSHFAHCANLFDMNAKYATVLSLHELEALMLGKQMQERAS